MQRKYFKYSIVIITFWGLLVLSSCVGESKPWRDQSVVGYIEYKQDLQKNVLVGLDSLFYHTPEFDDTGFYPEKSKWIIYGNVDLESQPIGYTEMTLKSFPIQFVDASFKRSTDSLMIAANERTINGLNMQAKMGDYLCVSTIHTDSIGQENNVELFFTEHDTLSTYNDCNVYTLYLRSYQQAAATDTLMRRDSMYQYFDLSSFIEEKKEIEKAQSNTAFYIRVCYINNITKSVEKGDEEHPEDIIKTKYTFISPEEKKYILIPVE